MEPPWIDLLEEVHLSLFSLVAGPGSGLACTSVVLAPLPVLAREFAEQISGYHHHTTTGTVLVVALETG